MRMPTIHLNGTGKKMLLEGYENAYHAIRDAEKALNNVEFNARDYYVQGPEAWTEAVKEMQGRFEALAKIKKEIEEIAEAIQS